MNGTLTRPQRASGFTLVELLLAVTLMSILLGLAYGGLRAATRATQSGQALLEASGSVRSAHQFVRRQLNQMQPLPFEMLGDGEDTRVVFQGDDRRIQFVGPMPGYLGQGGPQVQVIEFVPGAEVGLPSRVGRPVPGADELTVVATKNAITDTLAEFNRNRAVKFDCEVRDAAPSVDSIGLDYRVRRTRRDTSSTSPTVIDCRRLRQWQRQVGIQLAQKNP